MSPGRSAILRDPTGAANERFDVVIVGGGIYGCTLLLEASLRGLRALLLDRADFGCGTTRSSLGILHGGLRYLQNLDLTRHRESVMERRWFLQSFPDLVEILPCLMPLYRGGLQTPAVMRAALTVDRLLASDRNRGVRADVRLPAGTLTSSARVMELFPGVRRGGLRAGALWFDAFMPHRTRVLIETLRWACANGGRALNYVEVADLMRTRGGMAGVCAVDRESGTELEFRAGIVINAAGPACREFARRFDKDRPALFRETLAWNLLLDVAPPAPVALAVTAPRPGAQTYFLLPWQGRLLVGTGHAPAASVEGAARISSEQLRASLDEIEAAVPGLKVAEDKVLRIYAGHLPGVSPGTAQLAVRPVILDHGRSGGPSGLWSVSGVKFTTSRRVAFAALRRAFPGRNRAVETIDPDPGETERRKAFARFGPDWRPGSESSDGSREIRRLIEEEAVEHLDDLIFRRTSLADDPRTAREVAPQLCELFGWPVDRRRQELERLEACLDAAVVTQ